MSKSRESANLVSEYAVYSSITDNNVGIGTSTATSRLTVTGDVLVSGVVTATAFYGDGSNLTGVGGNVGGTVINYPSGGSSPFILSLAHVTENISLDSSVEPIDYKAITQEDKIVVDNGVTLTIGTDTTLIPDLFEVP
jgi:hypothetical protein